MKREDFSLANVLGLIFAVLLFWVFAFNIWFSNTILNQENFVNTTTSVLTSEASRNAIASDVVEVTQDNFPIIGTVTAPIIEKVVVGLLDTDLFSKIFTNLSEEVYFQLTTSNPKALEINIGGIIALIQPFLQEQDQELISNIPQKITLIGENEIPNISSFANTLALVGPVSLIVALLITGLVWRAFSNKRNYFIVLGLVGAASGFLVYSIIPVVGNYMMSGISSSNGIYIATSLYNAFTTDLVDFSLAILLAGLFTAFVAKFVKRSAFKLPDFSNTKTK